MLVIDRALVGERHLNAWSSGPPLTGLVNNGLATSGFNYFQRPLGALAQALRRRGESPGGPGFHGDLAKENLFDARCFGGILGEQFDADAFWQSRRVTWARHCQKRDGQ